MSPSQLLPFGLLARFRPKRLVSGHKCLNSIITQRLGIWPFISYNWLFLRDHTFHKWGYLERVFRATAVGDNLQQFFF